MHATIGLRLLLIQVMDKITGKILFCMITLYVDDSSFEAVGSGKVVVAAVASAVQIFAGDVHAMEMEFSPTKNVCLASSDTIAQAIIDRCPNLDMTIVRATKSLGGGLGPGK